MTGRPGNCPAHVRLQARQAITDYNRNVRPFRPRCSATARSTGEQCRRIAMENGKCDCHGGKTPRGKNWHRPQWPNPNRSDAGVRLDRKLRDRDRAAKKLNRRLLAADEAERESYRKWKAAHQPGDPAARTARRRQIAEARSARASLEAHASAPAIADSRLATLDAELAELQRMRDERAIAQGEGVFG